MEPTPTNLPLEVSVGPVPASFPNNVLYGNFVSANLLPAQLAGRRVRPGRNFRLHLSRALAVVHGVLETLWRTLRARVRRAPKALVVSETAALGDRRFVAVVHFEGQRFLIGSSPSSVTLLASLPEARVAAGASQGTRAPETTSAPNGVGV